MSRRCNELGGCLAVEAPQAGGIVVDDEGVEAGIIAFGMVDKTAGVGGGAVLWRAIQMLTNAAINGFD